MEWRRPAIVLAENRRRTLTIFQRIIFGPIHAVSTITTKIEARFGHSFPLPSIYLSFPLSLSLSPPLSLSNSISITYFTIFFVCDARLNWRNNWQLVELNSVNYIFDSCIHSHSHSQSFTCHFSFICFRFASSNNATMQLQNTFGPSSNRSFRFSVLAR